MVVVKHEREQRTFSGRNKEGEGMVPGSGEVLRRQKGMGSRVEGIS